MMNIRSNIPRNVLITGTDCVTGLNVIRALMGHTDCLVGCDCCPTKHNVSNILSVNNVTVPKASVGWAYIDALLNIIDEFDIRFIIPTNDHEVRAIASNRSIFHNRGIIVNAIDDRTLSFLDKEKTYRLFVEHDIKTPNVVTSLSTTTNKKFVVRPKNVGVGKKGVVIVSDHELKFDSEHIVTEFIQGDEYTIDVLVDHGKVLCAIPRLRREVSQGTVQFAELVNDNTIITTVTQLCESLELNGLYCIQCIKDGESCHYVEVNTRPGAGSDITLAAGVNLPLAWLILKSEESEGRLYQDLLTPKRWDVKMKRYQVGYFFNETGHFRL